MINLNNGITIKSSKSTPQPIRDCFKRKQLDLVQWETDLRQSGTGPYYTLTYQARADDLFSYSHSITSDVVLM